MQIIRSLLWIDCTAGALVGTLFLGFGVWFSSFYALPLALLHFMGAMNLLYAAYSFCLAAQRKRPRRLITILVAANGTWALVCLALAAHFFDSTNFLGVGQLIGEAIFVGGLAALEWKWCQQLLSRDEAA